MNKKFSIQIPDLVVEKVGKIATRNNVSIATMFRRYITLGILTDKEPIYIKRDGEYVEVDMKSAELAQR